MLLTVVVLTIGYLVLKHIKLSTSFLQHPLVFEVNGWQIQIKMTSLQIGSDTFKTNQTHINSSNPQPQRPTRVTRPSGPSGPRTTRATRFTRPSNFTRHTRFSTINSSNPQPQRPTRVTRPTGPPGPRTTRATGPSGPRTTMFTRPPKSTSNLPYFTNRGKGCRSDGMMGRCNTSTSPAPGCSYGKMLREHFLSDAGEVVTI